MTEAKLSTSPFRDDERYTQLLVHHADVVAKKDAEIDGWRKLYEAHTAPVAIREAPVLRWLATIGLVTTFESVTIGFGASYLPGAAICGLVVAGVVNFVLMIIAATVHCAPGR